MLYPTFRPLLFGLDPERAHRLALRALGATGRLPPRDPPGTAVDLMGLRFPNRVGLAAGFDKSAEAVDGLGRLGFGFIEVGTVTPRPQHGQPRPRLFRHPRRNALVNRLGFPNDGAAAVASRLERRRYRGVLGVNIGKNAETPIECALDDYVSCLRALHGVADYIALNISSPNTVALRDLHEPARLEPLLSGVLGERDRLLRGSGRRLPVLLKVSPDLDSGALRDVARVAQRVNLDGLVATNTTVQRAGVGAHWASESGGLSGAPLHRLALAAVTALRELMGPRFPIVGVGGIDSAAKGAAMRAAGADLVQIYTGLIYRGPALVGKLARALD
ncbi:MAG TPA: quinone-dependent dihydroorotate dehydrogenase [Gammaproteobacteria bacterium]|nr:quinone-dependent dihydroorotate dehydrogenase [Gammaproteobacteria bacterium]